MGTLEDLGSAIRERQRALESEAMKAQLLHQRSEGLQYEIRGLQEEIATLEKSGIVLNSLGEEKQIRAQSIIEGLVTRGLQQIFDDTLSFHIVQTTKAKSASVEFLVRTTLADGGVVDTPVMDARGGGLAATIGFLLRVVILLLRNGADKDNILILDETFAHVSAEYLDGLGEFLREIRDKTGIQIILVTHQPEFMEYADKVYRFTTANGRTVVTEDA
jgi:DNA repair exonuclease SbcCD ATPase subunit